MSLYSGCGILKLFAVAVNTPPTTLWFTASDGTDTDLTAGGGAGDITGSIGDNYIPIGTAADTIGNFTTAYVNSTTLLMGTVPPGYTSTSHDNTSFGYGAGYALTSGYRNTMLGKSAGLRITTGIGNIAIGIFYAE